MPERADDTAAPVYVASMSRLRRAVVPALLLALLPTAPAVAADRVHGDPVLLALGDSIPHGFPEPFGDGYPELVGGLLSDGYNTAADKATPNKSTAFVVENLAFRGATATGTRPIDLAAQVDRAVALIEARRSDRDPKNDVEVITLTIGGNDLFDPVLAACLPPTNPSGCRQVTSQQLGQVAADVEDALRRLSAAAGKHTEIVVTTYYNSLVAPCERLDALGVRELARQLAEVVLEGGTFLGGFLTVQSGLNQVIEQAAARTGAQVADISDDVGVGELIGDCRHPNAEGHRVIAKEVYAVLAR